MKHLACATGLWLVCGAAAHAQGMDITASVIESTNPGGFVYTQDQTLPNTFPNPKQTAELLYQQTQGWNLSGQSTQIPNAFASALAESDGNGGVGVSAWFAGASVPSNPQAYDLLAAQAIWRGTFNYLGSVPANVVFHNQVPTMDVGLIGVPANRDGISKTESAQVTVSLSSIITRADGTVGAGKGFTLQLRMDEYQILLSPGVYENYGADSLIGDWDLFLPDLACNSSASKPECAVGPFGGDTTMGTLSFGDSVTWAYSLLTTGSTVGREQGYFAFIGDPFGLQVVEGNLAISISPVPEPQAWLMMASGLLWLGRRRRFRP